MLREEVFPGEPASALHPSLLHRAAWEGQGCNKVLKSCSQIVSGEGFLCSVSGSEICQFVAEST